MGWGAVAPPVPPVIGRATPNEGRPFETPGFLPNALTARPLHFLWANYETPVVVKNGKQKRNDSRSENWNSDYRVHVRRSMCLAFMDLTLDNYASA